MIINFIKKMVSLIIIVSILLLSKSSFARDDLILKLSNNQYKYKLANRKKPFLYIPHGIDININSFSMFFYPKKRSRYIHTSTLIGGIRYHVSSNLELYYCVFQKQNVFKSIRIDEGFYLSNNIGISFSM